MNKPTDIFAMLDHEIEQLVKHQFDLPQGCCEGDSAVNEVEVEPALNDLAGWARHIHAKAGRALKQRSRGSFVESNDYDGDGGREHADYMDDND
jgi:hypothetical protein